MQLSIEEDVVLEVLDCCWGIWPAEVQTDVPLLFDVFVFGVILWFAETLHKCFEPTPMPVSPGNHLITDLFG